MVTYKSGFQAHNLKVAASSNLLLLIFVHYFVFCINDFKAIWLRPAIVMATFSHADSYVSP